EASSRRTDAPLLRANSIAFWTTSNGFSISPSIILTRIVIVSSVNSYVASNDAISPFMSRSEACSGPDVDLPPKSPLPLPLLPGGWAAAYTIIPAPWATATALPPTALTSTVKATPPNRQPIAPTPVSASAQLVAVAPPVGPMADPAPSPTVTPWLIS